MVASAGLFTREADPPSTSLKVHRSNVAPAAIHTRGTFPDSGGLTFRLPTPLQIRVADLKEPEDPTYRTVARELGGNFARGRGGFSHYCHMQQQAKQLIPTLPMQSRVDELNRVKARTKLHELQRTIALENLERSEQRRLTRLQHAKTLLHNPALSKDVGQVLQASCSLPSLQRPCGDQTPAMKLLNRRVDVNRLKKCRSQILHKVKEDNTMLFKTKKSDLGAVVDEIRLFEATHIPDALIETKVDWKSSTLTSWSEAEGVATLKLADWEIDD